MTDQRILQRVAATLRVSLSDQDGARRTTTAPIRVSVVRANESILLAETPAIGSGADYSITLSSAQTADLDQLTAVWTEDGEEVARTYVDIAGRYYFTLPDIRASDPSLRDSGKYPDAKLVEVRREVEDECERIMGRAWVSRYRYVRLDGTGDASIAVPDADIRSVRSMSVNGAAWALGNLTPRPRRLWAMSPSLGPSYIGPGIGNVLLGYEYGASRPPDDVRRAGLIRLRSLLNMGNSGIPDRATTFSVADGGTYSLATPGRNGFATGIPEVDAVYLASEYRLDSDLSTVAFV